VLVGSNPADTMPPAMQYFDEGRARGAQHVVVDPRRTATARTAALHLQPLPGTDLALANGLLHIAVAEGLVDERYVADRTTGFADVRAGVAAYWPDRVERITGVPVTDQRRTVFALARAKKAIVLTARGAEQHRSGTDTAQAWINLALALGLPGRPGSGWGTVTGQGNGQGGREHGQKADQLPGYRSLADPAARAHVAAVWGVDPDDLPMPGRSAFEMLDRLGTDGGVRTMLVLASNVAVSAPDARRVISRLADLDFLAVSDFFLSETAELADVVLPSAMWAEEDGTMTNVEGRVIRRRRALDPPAGVHDDLRLMADLAARLGAGDKFSADPETVFEELRRASAGGPADYSGISYARIDAEDGVFWPCPSPGHPGTPRLFTERFATSDGRARFLRVEHVEAHEQPDAEYPYVLTTGRVMAQYQSGTQTRRTRSLSMVAPTARAELHPDLARTLGIGPDDVVELATRRGRARFHAHVTDAVRPDVVFAPFHWGGASSANALTDPALDPTSRMPAFKVCAVAVTRVGGPDERIPAPPAATQPQTSAHRSPTTSRPLAPNRTPSSASRSTRVKSTPRFLHGVFPITGEGLTKPGPLDPALRYTVPNGKSAQALYFRGGNSTGELAYVLLLRDGEPMRWFPIGAKSDTHVPLRVVEDLPGGCVVELHAAAPEGVTGELVIDLGLVEV
jgi:assimilatory nitrate reductase catalytic subunit